MTRKPNAPGREFDFIVVGEGTGALVTTATLRRHGKSVIRVGAPFPLPDRPVGSGWCAEPPPTGFDAAGPPARGLLVRGTVLPLPLTRGGLARLLPVSALGRAGVALARARASAAIAAFVGGGREERTYKDWVEYRFGEPLYEAIFAPYARARFGPPESLLCGVARVVHGQVATAGSAVPARIFHDAGPTESAMVTAIREGCVTTEAGELHGAVVVDLPPDAVLRVWTGEHDATLDVEAAHLEARHGVEVFLTGRLPGGIAELHVIDAPFFRAVAVGDQVSLHLAVEPGAPEWCDEDSVLAERLVSAATACGLPGLTAAGAQVRRLARHNPVWRTSHLTRLRTWTDALVDGGIEPVGRLGLVAPMSPAAIASYAEDRLIHGATLRDCIRAHVEPPPRDAEARPRLSAFLTR